MCAASSRPSTSLWPLPARRKVLQTSNWRRRSRREKAMASLQQGPTGQCVRWTWKHTRTSPNTSAPPEGWASACSPMTSPWWFFHSVNEKKRRKETGQYLLFSLFPLSCVKSPSFTLSPSHGPHIRGCYPTPPPLIVTSCAVPTRNPRTEVVEMEKRVWPFPKMSAWLDGHASTSKHLHLLWLPYPTSHGVVLSCSRCQGFNNQVYSWTRH